MDGDKQEVFKEYREALVNERVLLVADAVGKSLRGAALFDNARLFVSLQSAIDAVDRAIEDEKHRAYGLDNL